MNIIITGASKGIGYELALNFCQDKNNQVTALARNKEKLEALKAEADKKFPDNQLDVVPFDLENHSTQVLDDIINKYEVLDILINNAGAMISKPFLKLTDDDWAKLYRVNLMGHVRMIRKFAPYMGEKSKAHIVNISSMGGFQGSVKFPGLAAYSASKAALSNLTEVLAEEFKAMNIAVNCLAIGAVQTEMLAETFPGYKAPVIAKEMASFVVDFALKNHYFMNGKIIPVALSTP